MTAPEDVLRVQNPYRTGSAPVLGYRHDGIWTVLLYGACPRGVGQPMTLFIIREASRGSRRFNDIRRGIPGYPEPYCPKVCAFGMQRTAPSRTEALLSSPMS